MSARRGRRTVQPARVVRHTPVLLEEVIDSLGVRAGGAYIDCTVGEGGHAEAVLDRAAGEARLLGIDLDGEALETARRRLEGHGQRAVLAEGSFRDLRELATGRGFVPADGVLLDLGVSSLQLESARRGFSFSRSGRLDMRFGASQRTTAYEVVNGESESGLAEIIRRYGEEKRPMRIARAIVAARPIETTVALAEVVSSAIGGRRGGGVHPATRTFQAIRMAVNEELQNLERGLAQAVEVLAATGRLIVISYHSLEDRMVKGFMRTRQSECICPPAVPQCVCDHEPTLRILNKRVIRPGDEELRVNPRSRSARMRVAARL